MEGKRWLGAGDILHEQHQTHSPSNGAALLLTNRQIHNETRSRLNSKSVGTLYKLDISLLNECDLFPTWISVPCLTTRVHALQVDIRLFGSIIPSAKANSLLGCGGRRGFHWSFYDLLIRFLRYGPVGEKKIKKDDQLAGSAGDISRRANAKRACLDRYFEDRHITIDVLTLDFQSWETALPFPPEDLSYWCWYMLHTEGHFAQDDPGAKPETYRVPPEWVAYYLQMELESILRMGYHTESYEKMLYERIGSIRIITPKGTTEINLGSRLAKVTFGWMSASCPLRIPALKAWKKKTMARRHELGLPVVWPKESEAEALET